MATSRAARSAPVWPYDIILVGIIGETTGCFEEIQGFELAFEDFVFCAHIILFS